jgi:transposase
LAKKYYPNKICYIQDNASYHKDKNVWEWFKENQKWIFVKNLPPYCPELNAAESIWKYTRMQGTHNQYFDSKEKIQFTLQNVFRNIQKKPKTIEGYIHPFL